MKIKVSISIEESTFQKVGNEVAKGLFRNKSHFIEYAVKKYLENGRQNGFR